MHFSPENLDLVAPAFIEEAFTEAEVFGSAVWLWMNSEFHRDVPLHALPKTLLPAIKKRQFIIASQNGKPVFYLSWAYLSEEAESRYIRQHPVFMLDEDWNSGDRLWFLDWVAPFGHTHDVKRVLERSVFSNHYARAMHHRGAEIGFRVKTYKGNAVSSQEAKAWFKNHPVT